MLQGKEGNNLVPGKGHITDHQAKNYTGARAHMMLQTKQMEENVTRSVCCEIEAKTLDCTHQMSTRK